MQELNFVQIALMILDVYIGWILVYSVLKLLRSNVRAVQIIKGVLLIYILNIVGGLLNLPILKVLTHDVITWGILAVIIIFQPEIRSGLEQFGRNSGLKRDGISGKGDSWIREILEAVNYLAEEKTGALIVIERSVSLNEFSDPATPLQAIVTSELLRTIFRNKTPLHDGAVIIKSRQVECAGAILPTSHQEGLMQTVGTRHRAALGISEISDSITIVVSEETGKMALAYQGVLTSYDKLFPFEKDLRELLDLKEEETNHEEN